MSNPLAKLFNYVDALATSKEGEVPIGIPCKPEILAMRQCLQESSDGVRI